MPLGLHMSSCYDVLSAFSQVPLALSVHSASLAVPSPPASVSDLQRVNMLGMRRLWWHIGMKNSLKIHKMAMFFLFSFLCWLLVVWSWQLRSTPSLEKKEPTRILQWSLGSEESGFERMVFPSGTFYDRRAGSLFASLHDILGSRQCFNFSFEATVS